MFNLLLAIGVSLVPLLPRRESVGAADHHILVLEIIILVQERVVVVKLSLRGTLPRQGVFLP